MLPSSNRLKKKKDFNEVFRKGRTVKRGFLVLKTRRNRQRENRFGIVVSQRVSKKAVVRNKIKRRLRETIKGNLKRIKKGRDIIIIALSESKIKSFQEINQAVQKILEEANLLL